MKKVTIHIKPKQGVLDPQGKAVRTSLNALGFAEVADVLTGKSIELFLEDHEASEKRIRDMCHKLLVNPVIEDYHFDVEEVIHS